MRACSAAWKGLGSLSGLGLFAYMIVQLVSWLAVLFEAYKPAIGTSAPASYPPSGVLLAGIVWVLPFSFHTVVLIFASRFGEGAYWANVARGLRLSSFAYLSQIIIFFGLHGVGFSGIQRVPAVLMGWSTCALVHWLVGRARIDDDGTRIVNAVAWALILWSLIGYICVITSAF